MMTLLQIQDGSLGELMSLFKQSAGYIIGLGFVFYGLSIAKQLVTNHERVKGHIITYLVALSIYLAIWALV